MMRNYLQCSRVCVCVPSVVIIKSSTRPSMNCNPEINSRLPMSRSNGGLMDERRLNRALNERMYLVSFNADTREVIVEGNRAVCYTVDLAKPASCTCQDFVYNGEKCPCKHIMFACVRFLHLTMSEWLEVWSKTDNGTSTTRALDLVGRRMREQQKRIDDIYKNRQSAVQSKYENEDCAICYEPIHPTNASHHEAIWTCIQCEHQLHMSCWNVWANRNPTCPLCRHNHRQQAHDEQIFLF